jgi:organic hydroperoxide reductase OsmC/OhrA
VHPYPHQYLASAAGNPAGVVTVTSPQLPDIETAPPPEFDGPGGIWSPESLLSAAVADCFILTFRGASRAAKFEWLTLECRVQGTLERVDGKSQFTKFVSFATLKVAAGSDIAKARTLLERAEHGCLIANSLLGTRTLETEIIEAKTTA